MDSVVTALLVAAVVLSAVAAVVAVLVLLRVKDRDMSPELRAVGGSVAQLEQRVNALAAASGTSAVNLQQMMEARLGTLVSQSGEDAARRIQTDAVARQELQRTLGDRLAQVDQRIAALTKAQGDGLDQLRTTNAAELERIRAEVAEKLQRQLKESLDDNGAKISALKDSLSVELEKVRVGNEAQLEKMRATVDEKLQGTLEKRLGESFKLVSDRLEQVQRGLGEMQTLATDVGGLKRVLSNVKSRGTWGEVQLSRQLQDLLTEGQYEENVAIKPGSSERVEFAVKLPGREDESVVYLPIDSKFPQEPYERLLEAQEEGEPKAQAAAMKDLEKALRLQAQTISGKYIAPPFSTDFAIMYLPTEGLFAEAVRIPGFASDIQRTHRVMITGPTTLMSLLNSLQMGFRTLAIEKRSSEVWQVLGAAKAEFEKYGRVWEKLSKQLQTAQNTVDEAGRRTRAVERKLQAVESFDLDAPPAESELPELTA